MNDLLDAMLAEANHLGCNCNALDDKLSDMLRRIVQRTRKNIIHTDNIRAAEERELLNDTFPFGENT